MAVVFVQSNLRIAEKITDIDYSEVNIEWGGSRQLHCGQ